MKKKIKKLYLQKRKRFLQKIQGTVLKPRISVFCSNKHIYAQLIDDIEGRTLVACSTLEKLVKFKTQNLKKLSASFVVGNELAKRALIKKLSFAKFDRSNKPYLGRIRHLAEGARNFGLSF